MDQYQDDDGCPELDNDSDGLADTADRCPNEPETRNGFEDEDGCPDVAPVPVPVASACEIQLQSISERIQFPHNQFRVLASSRAALREVIIVLREHPEIVRITVNAYASREGEEDANMALSQRRANAIRMALIRGGIDADRVVARAFGEQAPEVEGDSEEELAANRRVVFTIENEVTP
jgi:outer membrane protein OmpA-like peptidoglycan-associated protein